MTKTCYDKYLTYDIAGSSQPTMYISLRKESEQNSP